MKNLTRLSALSTLAAILLATSAAAQCPSPAPSPPTVDGFLDPVYAQRGFSTDYVANVSGATATLHQIDDPCVDPDFIYLTWEIDLGFTDNSYGDNRNKGDQAPWPGGHTFFDLAESDGQRLQILNVCGEDVIDIFMDYVDGPIGGGPAYATPSGYGVDPFATETQRILINGGDWSDFVYDTSILYNLNDLGFCDGGACAGSGPPGVPTGDGVTDLLVESPPWSDEDNFVPAAPYGAWVYQHFYEMRIDRTVFSTVACAQGTPALIRTDPVELHASPSKIGESPVDLFRSSSSIGDFIWLDADRDGLQDAGEVGLANVTVDLYVDADGDGIFEPDVGTVAGDDGPPRLTTVTDSNGLYVFDQLGAGTYFVDVTDTNGVLSGLSLTSGAQSSTDPTGAIVLPLGDEFLDADFGYAPPSLITAMVGDYLWSDADNDGIQDPGEAGLGGVTVDLVDAGTLAVIATTTTAADGSYRFTGVAAGDYFVDVTDTGGVLAGFTLTSGPQSEPDPSDPFHVDAGDVYLNADFGYFNASLGSIGNQIWFDADEDAVLDAGEPGIGNVTVALIDDADGDGVWDDGELILATTRTANDGTYSFTGLPVDDGGGDADADYLVWVSDTESVLSTLLLSIFLPLGNTTDGIGKIPAYAVEISAGSPADTTADFGYLLDNPEALIGDRVWYDANGDGVQDAIEPGIEGVTLLLYEDNNKNGIIDGQGGNADVVIGSRVTDVNGNYFFQRQRFDNNGEGYIVQVSDFNSANIFDGVLDLDGDGVAGEVNGDDTGTVDGVSVVNGLFDLDGDGTAGETNGDDTGFLSGFVINQGRLDLDRDGVIEANGDDSRFAPLRNYTQTGDPDEAGTCVICNGLAGTEVDNTTRIDLTLDFGFDSAGTLTIGDTVYHDLDGDGIQDGGEPGLELVTLALYEDLDGDGVVDVDDPLIAETATGAGGNYSFDALVSADYVVVVTDDNGILTGYTQTEGAAFEPVDSSELSTADVDFGFVRNLPATISNFIWEDLDGDGIQDGGEPGVPNVTINLYDPGGDGAPGGGDDTLVATTFTDGSGFYSFQVPPGDYYVEIEAPPAYAIGLRDQGGDDTLDSDPDPVTGVAVVTTLIIGENDPTFDGALFRPVTIGDRVWLDADGDGVQDVGETGLANVFVELVDAGADGMVGGGDDTVVATRVTDADGNYLFTGRIPSTYYVNVVGATVPGGLSLSGGSDPSTTSTLLSDQTVFTKDFGYTDGGGGAVIGDRVWSDADNDGVQDAGEPGIGGVTIQLLGAGADGVFGTADDTTATTTTAPDGSYLFTGVAAGSYQVDVTDTGNVLAGYTLTDGPQSSSDASAEIVVAADDVFVDADFGYFQAGLGTIGDRVWNDGDGDGVRDAGEDGIGGVGVSLVADTDGDGVWDPDGADDTPGTADDEPIVAGAFTAADGTYSFTGLSLDDGGGDGDADYLVVVADPDAVLAGLSATSGMAGTNDNSQSDPYAVALSAGTPSDLTADFGYQRAGTLGDRIWSDADGDGVQDAGEAGLGGVTVDLVGAGADGVIGTADDVVLATRTTAPDGSYLFTLVLPGDYRVVVTDTGNVLTGTTPTGDPDEAGTCATCDGEGSVTLAAGASDLSLDFGYQNAALRDVSGTVFEDVDRDGFHDAADEGEFEGVTVALWHDVDGDGVLDPAVDELVATTLTDAGGNYAFTGLPDDDYLVVVSDTSGVLGGYELTSGRGELPVTVAGADVTDLDFGYVREGETASIGDVLWLDADPPGAGGPDGLPGANEARLPGVTVDLYRDVDGDGIFEPGGDDGAPVATTVTDADGRYLFDNLAAGDYFVDVDESTLPDTTADATADLVETTYPAGVDPSAVIHLSDGEDYRDADFGYVPRAGTAVMGDFVWYDADGDGLQDPGEVGIGGVDVTFFGAGPDGELGTADDTTGTTTTAADGSYLFTGLAPDDYVVFFDPATLPAGYGTTPTNTGADSTYSVTLEAGDTVTLLDWGFQGGSTGTIGDSVWLDLDGDGMEEAGEPGIAGVTVNLVGPGSNGVFGDADDEILATTTTTDSDGDYLFAGVPLGGDYRVEVSDLDGVLDGLQQSTADPGTQTPTGGTPDLLTADFGYVPGRGSGSIGTLVWHDLDGDGDRDAGEPPIEGVTVALWHDVDGNGTIDAGTDNLLRSDVTDVNGEYELAGLPAGDYLVDVTDTAGVLTGFTKTTGLAGTDDNSQADPYTLSLSALAPDNLTADFGYRDDTADAALAISGTVFVDDNINAAFDELTEARVQNVEVLLFRRVADDLVLLGRTTTDVNGDYSFGDLPPGDYEIAVDPTATTVDDYAQTTQTTTGGRQQVTLVNADSVDNDFGFFDDGVALTPVTLSYFEARGARGRVEIAWRTATEVGHVGFNLWQWLPDDGPVPGGWQLLNREIVPSTGVDSIDVRAYRFEAEGARGQVFLLEDLDIRGRSTFHGPFALGKAYGDKDLANRAIDWPGIRGEHAARKAERAAALRGAAAFGKAAFGKTARRDVKLLVEEDGIYRVTYEELAAAGLDLAGVNHNRVALLHGGRPWPLRVDGPTPRFGPGSFVEFVGFGLDTLYTRTNVYRLRVDPPNASRVREDRAAPRPSGAPGSYAERLHVERDRAYSFASPNGDPWFDTGILAFGSPRSASFAFETEGRVEDAGPIVLDVGLWGVTDWARAPDHHVVIDVNGVQLADELFDGLTVHPVSVEVPESALVPGENLLTITVPGDTGVAFDLVNVDDFAVTYPRRFAAREGGLVFEAAGEVFEVTGLESTDAVVYRQTADGLDWLSGAKVLGAPGDVRVRFPGSRSGEPATYWLASGAAYRTPGLELARPEADITRGEAELLVLSHPDFLAGLEPLVAAREAQGWAVQVVDVEDVYARFGGDVVDPEAIRDYIAFAHRQLGTRAVLLVGGDTYDYFDVLGLGSVSFLPSLYGRTGDIVRFAPADGLYADLDGDEVPDLAIGRFPVRTAAELDGLVQRTLDYELLQDRRSLVLAADDYDAPTRFDFTQVSEQMALRVPETWQVDRAYVDVLGVDAAREELLDKLDQGVALTSFMGHSGPISWSFDGLFSASDAEGLENAGLPTVVAQWGCWTTYYVSPRNETLAHRLLLSGDRGAAAVLGATTLTEARSERALSLEIFGRLFEPGQTLGNAILEAKRALADTEDPAVIDVLIGWNLLGDPTLGLEAGDPESDGGGDPEPDGDGGPLGGEAPGTGGGGSRG